MSDEHWFEYHRERLPAFYHMYNLTHLNERMVELAIAHAFLDTIASPWEQDEGLEVGNVLGHYERRRHYVWDLHEPAAWYQDRERVYSRDILEMSDSGPYPWVISLSTIEHTESPLEALMILLTLAPRGLVTFPTGVRGELDSVVLDPTAFSLPRFCTISRRENDHGGWEQDPEMIVQPYGPWANTVAVLEWG